MLMRRGDNRLPILAGEINAEHEAAELAQRDSMQHALHCGELLSEAKRAVEARDGYGHWLSWLKANVKFSVRTANLYMQIADLPTELSQRVANLPLRDAINAALRKKEFKRSVEYYTESSCIEAARRVMGEIDLDPASCETAQHVAPYSISGRTTT